jgi:tRNA A37 threonylcarbamoyladenosine synthetase subunit TsaC/SUA5/YrdC
VVVALGKDAVVAIGTDAVVALGTDTAVTLATAALRTEVVGPFGSVELPIGI